MKKYDYILIGTGQATGTIIPELLNMKKSVAVVENDRVGGTCVNHGCSPTKTLVATARVARVVQRSGSYGIKTGSPVVAYERVRERFNRIREDSSRGMEEWLRDDTDFYPGTGRFRDSHVVTARDREIFGHTILIHTGTRAFVPDYPGVDQIDWLDNRTVLDLETLPSHLIVVGGSYVALEFAQIFRRLGSEVTVLQRSARLMSREDADIAELVRQALESEGIRVICSTDIIGFQQNRDTVTVRFRHREEDTDVTGSHVLFAAGRVPNTGELNAEAAGVTLDEKGYVTVDDHLKTSVDHIFALGDVNRRGAFTHTSVHDGQIFLDNLRGGVLSLNDRIPISAMFIDPPLARVGMNEKQVRKSEKKALMATRPMDRVSRAIEKGETTGLIKLLVEADSERLLGAAILGVGGDEVIGMLALGMQAGLTYKQIQETVLVHPTLAEIIPWVFNDLKPLE